MNHVEDLSTEIAMMRVIIKHQHEAGRLNDVARNIERLAKIIGAHRRMTGGGNKIDELMGSLLQEVGEQLGIPN